MIELSHAMMRDRTNRPHALEELFHEKLAGDLPIGDQRAFAYALRARPEFTLEELQLVIVDRFIDRRRTRSADDDATLCADASNVFRLDIRKIRKACIDRTREGFARVRRYFQSRSLHYLGAVIGETTDSSVVTHNVSPSHGRDNTSTSHQRS